METYDIDYDGLRLLSASVAPSQYIFCPDDTAKLVGWQVAMADNTVRDVLFSEVSARDDVKNVGSKIFFNAKSMPLSGFESMDVEGLRFRKSADSEFELIFEVDDVRNFPCRPRVTYKLSELYFHVEISLTNTSSMPMYWRPEVHFFVNLPWTDGVSLEKYVVKSWAKKRLRVSDEMRVVSSVKSAERTPLELLNDGALGFGQLQDSKVWIGAPNEEEGLSFIFGNRTQRSAIVIGKTKTDGKVEVSFLSDIPEEGNKSVSNGDMQNYTIIPPNITDSFSAEILAY
jgi:hypothetical protein